LGIIISLKVQQANCSHYNRKIFRRVVFLMDDHKTPAEGQNTDQDKSAPPVLPTTSPRTRGVIGAGILIIVAILAVAAVSYVFPGSGGRTETVSGLQYTDEVVGTGDPVGEGDMVLVHYTGYLEDGTEFDSVYDRFRAGHRGLA
jgi:hypothetical protein